MRLLILLFLIGLFGCDNVMAAKDPNEGAIKGYVMDSETGEKLVGVNIQLEGTLKGAASDSAGSFVIQDVAPGNYSLVVTSIGYAEKRIQNITVSTKKETMVTIELTEELLSISEIVVTPGSFAIMGNMPASQQTLGSEDMKNISFSEDITRAVSRLPGVASNDFAAKFTVRGGEADEVLMNLDGMDLYEPFHQRDFSGGLFSIVDIETIEGIDLLTGGFSAEYGDRQSAVFKMRTKQVPDNQSKTSLGLSITNARLYHDGNFSDNRGKYLFSIRKGMLDQALKLIGEEERIPEYYDLMAKVEYKLGKMHTLSMHFLHSGDKTKIRDISEEAYDKNDTQYYNSYSWLTLKSYLNPQLYLRTLLYGGLIML